MCDRGALAVLDSPGTVAGLGGDPARSHRLEPGIRVPGGIILRSRPPVAITHGNVAADAPGDP